MARKKIKYAVLVPDGMADLPLEELGGRTPLEVARTPNMDFLAKSGKVGQAAFVPEGMIPGSDVANLAIFGYDPKKFYTGRAPFEAINLGIDLKDDEIAFRCNFITEGNNLLIDYSAGHITSKEAQVLIKVLNKNLASAQLRFYPGVSYRHLLVVKGGNDLLNLKCFPPHDIMGQDIAKNLPQGKSSEFITGIMEKSRRIIADNEINLVRIDLKENPANMIWLWGQGRKVNLPLFKEKYGIQGSVISAVDLIKGIGRALGLDVLDVPGATGYYDTNYEKKAEYALKSLDHKDFVFVHVEAPDEAGHNADTRAKISAIENFDRFIVGGFLEKYKDAENIRIMVLPDHPTPISLRTHTSDPVCFVMFGAGIDPGEIEKFDEKEARASTLAFENGYELMSFFINQKKI